MGQWKGTCLVQVSAWVQSLAQGCEKSNSSKPCSLGFDPHRRKKKIRKENEG